MHDMDVKLQRVAYGLATSEASRVVQSDHQTAHGRKETIRSLWPMKVAIHQPCFLPWLGYLDRMARSDLFVLLDHVQFERRGYQNRTPIRMEGEQRWLTVPVVQ